MLFATETQNLRKIITLIPCQSVSAAKLICQSAATRINTYRFNVVCYGNTEFTENHYLIPWQSVFHCKKLICESAATWIDTDTLMLFATETQNSRKIIT
ncbi:hypothetical protein DU508_01390 [Pedobacter chinensis]|uniref:Uncharacterized protein n=1 Tax=Pedobacter chinensis TaxID=2282421 RepID=A0A369PYU1_9SPHI|nr:hypothetical protein DU508_01390 [Pedobacter chinensis]